MTETEWMACADPEPMLAFRGARASDRKLRLFACACVRRIWGLVTEESSRSKLLTAEAFVDGRISQEVLEGVQALADEEALAEPGPQRDEQPQAPTIRTPLALVEAATAANTAAWVTIEDGAGAAHLASLWAARAASVAIAQPSALMTSAFQENLDWEKKM